MYVHSYHSDPPDFQVEGHVWFNVQWTEYDSITGMVNLRYDLENTESVTKDDVSSLDQNTTYCISWKSWIHYSYLF